jgi:hypothetical protein
MVAKKPNYSLSQALTDIATIRNQLGTPINVPQYYADQSADTVAPGAGTGLYSLTGNMKYVSWLDGNNYDTGTLTQWLPSQQTFNTGSGQAMTPLTFNLGIGTYHFKMHVPGTTGAAAGNATINFIGPSASMVAISAIWIVQQAVITRTTTSFAGAITSTGLTSGTITCWIKGMMTITAAGSFYPQGVGASADTWGALIGTHLTIQPVTG